MKRLFAAAAAPALLALALASGSQEEATPPASTTPEPETAPATTETPPVLVVATTEPPPAPTTTEPPPETTEPPPPVVLPQLASPRSLSARQLYRLRLCESTDNYGETLIHGTNAQSIYSGAYQFDQPTWDGVARRHALEWLGVKPSNAPPEVQDAFTQWLWAERGPSPWPVCGYRVGAA